MCRRIREPFDIIQMVLRKDGCRACGADFHMPKTGIEISESACKIALVPFWALTDGRLGGRGRQ